ncbi:7641_t:CDS:1 [Cetraspora pellucida]|uniref:7641_t:CDS:1 n=1 Tax=Cetraspora pellucida TaxID=1433469 RepID=A0ACA9K7J5_9GLOM|nr:7641_t:CDS:1 [Cetraspora pellucida]
MDTLVIPVFIQFSNQFMLTVNALIDSGTLVCFFDYILAYQYNLLTSKKRTPLMVEVIDSQEILSEAVIYETGLLMMRYQDHYEEIKFNLIQMLHHHVILRLS